MLMFLPPVIGGIAFGIGMAGIIGAVSQHEPPERPHSRINGQRYFNDQIPAHVLERLQPSQREAIETELRNYEAAP